MIQPTPPIRFWTATGSRSSMPARPSRCARCSATFRPATLSQHISRSTPPSRRARGGPEITLLSNSASSSSSQQTLFDCASYSVGADPDATGDPCLSATTQVLTVNVPNCAFQVDLIYGEPLATMTQRPVPHRPSLDRRPGRQPRVSVHHADANTHARRPTPTASVSPVTDGPTPVGGVQGITTPGTGSGGFTLPLMGLALIGLGIGAIVRSSRRRPSPPMP